MANTLHNNEAEQQIIAATLRNPEQYFEINETGLIPTDFANRDHTKIWQAVFGAIEKKADPAIPLVIELLREKGHESVVDYVTELTTVPCSVTEAAKYAKVVKGLSVARELGMAGARIIDIAQEKRSDYFSAIVEAENTVRAVAEGLPAQERSPSASDILDRLEIVSHEEKIPIHFSPTLNSMTGGLAPGHFWVIGGFSSTGKSAFAANLVLDVLKKPDQKVAIISAEMTQEQYIIRLLAIKSGVSQQEISSRVTIGITGREKVLHAREYLAEQDLFIYDNLYRLPQIRTEMQRLKNQKGLDVMVLDYIQNVSVTGDEVKDAREVALECQRLAKDLQCTVVAFSQVSNAQARFDIEGGDEDFYSFKGHGAIRDAADVAVMLKRNRTAQSSMLKVDIKKNRHGPISRFYCDFNLQTGRMIESEYVDEDDA